MDIKQIAKDPDFQSLPINEQRKAFIEADPDFAQLPVSEQIKGISELTGKSQPSVQRPSYLSRVGSRIAQVGSDIMSPEVDKITNPTARGQYLTGKVASGVSDIIGDTASEAYRHAKGIVGAMTPNIVKQGLEKTNPMNRVSDQDLQDIKKEFLPMYEGVKREYSQFKKDYPNLSAFMEGTANIAMAAPVGFGGKKAAEIGAKGAFPVAKEAANIIKDTKNVMWPAIPEKIDRQITATIKNGADRANITPKGVKSAKDIASFDKSMRNGVVAIVQNKSNLKYLDDAGDVVAGRLPQTANEFAQVIPQVKAPILQRYKAMTKAAGDEGVMVDTKAALDVIEAFEKSPLAESMSFHYPESVKKISALKERYAANPAMTPEAMEAEITILNRMINKESDPFIDFVITGLNKANRQNLSKAIDSIEGANYQELKNTWGALNEIEGRVTHRANLTNKGTRGIGYWDMASLAECIAGIATLNPAIVFASVGTKTGAELLKHYKGTDRTIKNMFKNVDEQLSKANAAKTGYKYQSKTLQKMTGEK